MKKPKVFFEKSKTHTKNLWKFGFDKYLQNDQSIKSMINTYSSTWKDWIKTELVFNDFKYNNISINENELLREYIWQLKKLNKKLIMFKGDNPQFLQIAIQCGIDYEIIERNRYDKRSYYKNEHFLYSNPSYIDGQYWINNEHFLHLLISKNINVKVSIDVGLSGCSLKKRRHPIKLLTPNIDALFFTSTHASGNYATPLYGVLTNNTMEHIQHSNEDILLKFNITNNVIFLNTSVPNEFSRKMNLYVNKEIKKIHKDTSIKPVKTDVWFLLKKAENNESLIQLEGITISSKSKIAKNKLRKTA